MAANGFTATTANRNSTQFLFRRQFCTIHNTNSRFPGIATVGRSLQFRRFSSHDTRSVSRSARRLIVPDSKSSARFVKFSEVTSSHVQEQIIPERHGDDNSTSATTTRILSGPAAWEKARDELRKERLMYRVPETQLWGQEDGTGYYSENHKRIFYRNPSNKIETPFRKSPTSVITLDKTVKQSHSGATLLNENSTYRESLSMGTTCIPSLPEDKVLGNSNSNGIKTKGSPTSVKKRTTVSKKKGVNDTKHAIEKEATPVNDDVVTIFPNSLKSRTKTEEPAPNGAASAVVNGVNSAVIETKVVPLNHGISKMLTDKIYGQVLVVDSISVAKEVVKKLTDQYRHLVYGCDTEVAKIDVKLESPVDHGEIICFSIYGGPNVDFGNGMSCIWVDVLDGGGKDILFEFAPFFEDPAIKKVWHNYSFDNHIVENYGIKLCGFHADTMHMARLWDSSRRTQGGYSLEALSGNKRLMSKSSWNPTVRLDDAGRQPMTSSIPHEDNLIGKVSMKTIFGRKKLKKDGSEGKVTVIPPVEELQREEREPWICYSALDSINTLRLYESLKTELKMKEWICDETTKGNMFDFYETHWRPFGELLVKMETEGMLVVR